MNTHKNLPLPSRTKIKKGKYLSAVGIIFLPMIATAGNLGVPKHDEDGKFKVWYTTYDNEEACVIHERAGTSGSWSTMDGSCQPGSGFFEVEKSTGTHQFYMACYECWAYGCTEIRTPEYTTYVGTIEHTRKVYHHSSITFSNSQADSILSSASSTLQTADTGNDIGCPVKISREGNVTSFSNGNGSITTQSDFGSLSAGFNVVSDITWCGGIKANIIGCADEPGNRIAVVRHTSAMEGFLWAHEFGHNQGLGHRNINGAIMRDIIYSNSKEVSNHECNYYRQ
ncbi:matrixin family metalloprotease [Microbulbifer sp. SH-1]|uniref:matrixin family metalloprotease n=1 Tax=Microbulbifer sp. SH-1 TaxID=2681547 RepID=UPI00140C9D9A|nr:matrixin family metalloprotease [Microbulbifer sp. SH-1]QIL90169.1 matrixin family metalloprotease [Microbulbifer sp. SH-1]